MTDTRITHEIEANPVAAELARDGDRWVLTMRRLLRHAPERVWPMLTEPERLARWSPFVPDRTIEATGPATARENPGDPPREAEVLTFDPPHELVHRYGDDVLRWTLVAEDDGTLLTLEQTLDGASPRRGSPPAGTSVWAPSPRSRWTTRSAASSATRPWTTAGRSCATPTTSCGGTSRGRHHYYSGCP